MEQRQLDDLLGKQTDHPLKIFVSYGHTEEAVCGRIVEALRRRGHSVWFDRTHIKGGKDWREEITAGLLESDAVLFMLSRHSVRDPGVCLDEMSIAIGVKGGNYRTILLEPEETVSPPPALTARQWLDMSQWPGHMEDPEDPWMLEKLAEVIEILESPEVREFSGQIGKLRSLLPLSVPGTARQQALLQKPFTGRTWLADRIGHWLDDPGGPSLCLVYGDPGIGKSAFAARYAYYHHRVAAAIFCEYSRPGFSRPEAVIQTLAFLLACRLPDYRLLLLSVLEDQRDLGLLSPSELFELLLGGPLRIGSIHGNRETLCVLIDGLDEAGDTERNVLTEVLARCREDLPSWIRILAFSRKVSSVTGPLGRVFHIDLLGDREENREDIRDYFREALAGRDWKAGSDPERLISVLTKKSGGIFIYAVLMADAAARNQFDPENEEGIPENLDAAFFHWFRWFFPDPREYETGFLLPLACMAASPGPVPVEELRKVFSWTRREADSFFRRLEVLVRKDRNDFDQETLQFSHRFIREWLVSEAAGVYRIFPEDADERMGEVFYEIFREAPESLTEYEAGRLPDLLDIPLSIQAKRRRKEVITSTPYMKRLLSVIQRALSDSRFLAAERYLTLSVRLSGEASEISDSPDLKLFCCGFSGAAGELYEKLGFPDKADEMYTWGTKFGIAHFEKRPDPDLAILLGNNLIRICGRMKDKGNYEDAMETARRLLEMAEEMVRTRGNQADLGFLMHALGMAADLSLNLGKIREAISFYESALETSRRIDQIEWDPESSDTARQARSLARLYHKLGRYQEAQVLFREALSGLKELADRKASHDSLVELADCCEEAGDLYYVLGRTDTALFLYEKGMDILKKLIGKRRLPKDCLIYVQACLRTGTVYEIKKEDDRAEALYKDAMAFEEVLMDESLSFTGLEAMASCCEKMAHQKTKHGLKKEAMDLFRRSYSIRRQILKDRGLPEDQRALILSRDGIAGLLEEEGDMAGAMALYKKNLAVSLGLIKDRGLIDDQRDLAVAYARIAECCRKQGQTEEAWEMLQKRLETEILIAQITRSESDYQEAASFCAWLSSWCMGNGKAEEGRPLIARAMKLYADLHNPEPC